MTITPLQHKIYHFIRDYIGQHGYAPSLVEMARGIGVSPKSVSLISRSVHALVASGHLTLAKKGYRNITLATETNTLSLPLLGRIAAGVPIAAIEDRHEINLTDLLQGHDRFILEVKGDSMVDEGILEGDLVICRQVTKAHEGDIVVALIDQQEATLKRISYKIAQHVTLIPANATLKPKAYAPHRVEIQGIFVGLIRIKK